MFVGSRQDRHAFVPDLAVVLRLDDVLRSGFDENLAVVEVGDDELEARERVGEGNFLFHKKVNAVPSEGFVRLFFDDEDEVAWGVTGCLVRFAAHDDFFTVFCSLLDFNGELFLFFFDFLSVTGFTPVPVGNALSFTVTIFTTHLLFRN